MATREDLYNLSKQLADTFCLSHQILKEDSCRVFNEGSNLEIMRLELFDLQIGTDAPVPTLGIAFHVETLNTDAIVIFGAARRQEPNVELLGCYYQDASGGFHRNLQAYILAESDKENKAKHQAIHEYKLKEVENWQITQLERQGKLKVH